MHENETVRSSIKISLWRNEKAGAAERDACRRGADCEFRVREVEHMGGRGDEEFDPGDRRVFGGA